MNANAILRTTVGVVGLMWAAQGHAAGPYTWSSSLLLTGPEQLLTCCVTSFHEDDVEVNVAFYGPEGDETGPVTEGCDLLWYPHETCCLYLAQGVKASCEVTSSGPRMTAVLSVLDDDSMGVVAAVPLTERTRTTTSTSPPTTTTTLAPLNLLINGGFEEGPIGWLGWNSSQNAGDAYVIEGDQCEGDLAARLYDSSSRTRSIYQEVPVQPDREYRLSALVRTEKLGSNQARMTIEWRAPGGVMIRQDEQWIEPGTTPCWRYMIARIAPIAAAHARIILALGPVTDGVPANWGMVSFDDVMFTAH